MKSFGCSHSYRLLVTEFYVSHEARVTFWGTTGEEKNVTFLVGRNT